MSDRWWSDLNDVDVDRRAYGFLQFLVRLLEPQQVQVQVQVSS